jgi:hypothetical protein
MAMQKGTIRGDIKELSASHSRHSKAVGYQTPHTYPWLGSNALRVATIE